MQRTNRVAFRFLWAAALWAAPVPADEVILKTGGALLGEAFRENGVVRVELETGTMIFPESAVERIVPGLSPAEIKALRREERLRWLEERIVSVGLHDARGLYRVAEDARLERFPDEEVDYVLGLVLGADGDHAAARADRGEVRYAGRWMSREEARALEARTHSEEMRARGFLLFRGEWMKAEEIEWREIEQEWERTISRLESERDTALYEVSDLESRLSSALTELGSSRSVIADLESRVGHLECEVSALEGELGACRGELSGCRSSLGSCESDLGSCESQLGSAGDCP